MATRLHGYSSVEAAPVRTTAGPDALAADVVSQLDDVRLLERYRSGDRGAFEEIYRRYAPSVRAVCRYRLGDVERAEDAVQETFARAVPGLRNLEPPATIGRWLRRVAKNHCIDVIRSDARAHGSVDLGAATGPRFADRTAERELDRVLSRAVLADVVDRLSDRDRELLVRHHVHGVSLADLADAWDVTRGSMAVAVHRARTRARALARTGAFALVPSLRSIRHRARDWFGAWDLGGLGQAAHHGVTPYLVAATLVLSLGAVVGGTTTDHPGLVPHDATAAIRSVPDRPASPDSVAAPSWPARRPPPTRSTPAPATGDRPSGPATELASVPGTRVAVHRTRPADPQRRLGARVETSAGRFDLWVESADAESVAPAEDAACVAAATTAEAVVYCDD